jgi:hypothetical protein
MSKNKSKDNLSSNFINKLNEKLINYSANSRDIRYSRVISEGTPGFISIMGKVTSEGCFGVLPEMSIEKIKKDLIYSEISPLLEKEAFTSYVESNKDCWSFGNRELNKIPKDLSLGLLGKCIIAITHEFSVQVSCERVFEESGILQLENILREAKVYYHISLNEKQKKRTLEIHGRLSSEQCSRLELEYELLIKGDCILLIRSEDKILQDDYDKKINWTNLYKELQCSHYLYSGVITDIEKVGVLGSNEANLMLSKMQVQVGRTTYATVLGLGHPKLSKDEGKLYKSYLLRDHPFFSDFYTCLKEYDNREIQLQLEFFNNLINQNLNTREFADCVNIYLSKSIFPHVISIAGNIITSDDYCLYTKRGNEVEHEGKYSCSLTGYSEIYDKSIDFYRDSVEDDKPSIKDTSLFSFSGEFVREARAELGITTQAGEWKYHGLIVSGKYENIKSFDSTHKIQPSTIDFEVIGQANVIYSLNQIIHLHKNSIEKDENNNLYGFKINLHRDWIEAIKDYLNIFLNSIVKNKDLIIILLLIYPFIDKILIYTNSVVLGKLALTTFLSKISTNPKTIIELIINICLIYIFINDAYKKLNDRKYKKGVSIFSNKVCRENNLIDINYFNDKLFRGKIYKNATYLSITLFNIYLLDLLNRGKQLCD